MKLLTSCLLAAACLLNAHALYAQDEPIAVAKPAEEVLSDAAASDAPKSEVEKISKPEIAPTKLRPLTISVQLLRSDLIITGALTDFDGAKPLKRHLAKPAFPYPKLLGCVSPSAKIPAPPW